MISSNGAGPDGGTPTSLIDEQATPTLAPELDDTAPRPGDRRGSRGPVDLAGRSDPELVVAIARRDHDALAEVYRRHGLAVHSLARRMCGQHADDVVQEVFLRLWQQPERYDPDRGTLKTFLVVQAHGRTVERLRSDSARRTRESADLLRRADAEPGVETAALTHLAGESIARALCTLPERERRVIFLAYFRGHTYREVATILGMPEGTVKSRIRAALTHLRTRLGPAIALDQAGAEIDLCA